MTIALRIVIPQYWLLIIRAKAIITYNKALVVLVTLHRLRPFEGCNYAESTDAFRDSKDMVYTIAVVVTNTP